LLPFIGHKQCFEDVRHASYLQFAVHSAPVTSDTIHHSCDVEKLILNLIKHLISGHIELIICEDCLLFES